MDKHHTTFKEMARVSLPLMLSFASTSLMMFSDRLLLARFSLDALNAASTAAMTSFVFLLLFIPISSIAEVYVGQHNGAREYRLIGRPVWQMIWFSALTAVLYWPLGKWGMPFLIPESVREHGGPYFSWVLYSGPFFVLLGALSGFYMGRKKVILITASALLANGVNIALDWIFIFGIDGFIDPMGTKGAALATGASQVCQCLLLFCVMLRKKYRQKYGTTHIRFYANEFWQCIKVGFPISVGHVLEVAAWTVFFHMMVAMGSTYLTVASIVTAIFNLFTFSTEGLNKGVISLASNSIGAQIWSNLRRILRSAVLLHLCVLVLGAVFFFAFPEQLLSFFIGEASMEAEAQRDLLIALRLFWVFMLFDGLTWILAGLLIAAEDTRMVMFCTSITPWLTAILPCYLFIVRTGAPVYHCWFYFSFYALSTAAILYWRFRSGKWKQSASKNNLAAD